MDIEKYINSGILEQYVLNSTTPQEKQEVECLSHIYPEIKAELIKIQSALEQMAVAAQVTPHPSIKTRILENIKKEKQVGFEKEGKVIPLTPEQNNSTRFNASKTVYQLLIASCFIGIASLVYYNYTLQIAVVDSKTQLVQIENTLDSLSKDYMDEKNMLKNELAFFTDEKTTKINLEATPNYDQFSATLYWNSESKEVFLEASNLPKPKINEQYQLWAIVEGVPQDLGTIESLESLDSLSNLLQMQSVLNPQAFAITIEPVGGSLKPTLEQMCVLGKV